MAIDRSMIQRIAAQSGVVGDIDALMPFARAIEAAARAEQREEDAVKCDRISDEYQEREGRKYAELRTDAECGARECADAIRAGGE